MKRYRYLTVLIGLIALSIHIHAQENTPAEIKKYKVAIFAPLYLDSVFKGNVYKYGNKPSGFVLPGLNFVQGAKIALDNLIFKDASVEAKIYDSKSYKNNVAAVINNNALNDADLIIGSVKDEDYLQLAKFCQSKKIPFVSATYPNDGGVTGNPYLYIANSTLKSHCEAIYSYLIQNHSGSNILHLKKSGNQEERITGYLNSINQPDNLPLLKIKSIQIDSNFNSIVSKLDSTRKNVLIAGSLDEEFASNLASTLLKAPKKYDVMLIGMPNWDGFKNKEINSYPFYYTSSYFNNKEDEYSRIIQNEFLTKYKGNPSDFAYKGFEITYIFSNLMITYGKDLATHVNDKTNKIFSGFNFMPVYPKKNKSTPDYFENKHLFFIKRLKGSGSIAWE